MPEDTTVTTPGEMPEDPQDGGTPSEGMTLEQLQAKLAESEKHIRKLNRESAERRKALDAFEAEKAKREETELSELDKAKQRAADLEAQSKAQAEQVNAKLIKAEVRAVAGQMGFRDLSDAQLADLSEVEITDDGDVKGVKEALEALAKAKPYLLSGEPQKPAAPQTGGGQGNTPASGGAVLTPGEQAAVQIAQSRGYAIDPEKVAARKAQTRVVTNR